MFFCTVVSFKNSPLSSFSQDKMADDGKEHCGDLRRVLMVLTSHDKLGDTGKPTGWYLPEAAHPWHVFHYAEWDIDWCSPKGGAAPCDPGSIKNYEKDEVCQEFLKETTVQKNIQNTKKPSDIDPKLYNVIFYVGGHGPMWDLVDNKEMQAISAHVFEKKHGVVAAVCHGSSALLNVKLSNGDYMIKGHTVTGFTNAEEEAVGLTKVVPFALETELVKRGAKFSSAKNLWEKNIESSSRVITGQNPASATAVAEAVVVMVD